MNRETITLESIKKLRESSHLDDYKWTLETGEVVNIYGNEPNDLNAVNWGEQWRNIADEIEAEITAKYIKTPLDAVGTPIHVGDKVFWYAVGYFDVIGIGEQVVLDKGDSRYAIVPSDVLEVVATRFTDAFVAREDLSMSDELLPCPCCGGEAKFQIFDKACNIECQVCFIGTRFESIDNAELVVETWNKRVKRYPESLAQRMIVDGYEYELFELRNDYEHKLSELRQQLEKERRTVSIAIKPGTELEEGSVIHIDDDGNMTLEA